MMVFYAVYLSKLYFYVINVIGARRAARVVVGAARRMKRRREGFLPRRRRHGALVKRA
jgi:hypothetical protein